METNKQMSLGFKAQIKPIEKVNEEFTRAKCFVAAHGKNRNFSFISKETFEEALPTLAYCPVTAHLFLNEETGEYQIGGHDVEFVVDETGVNLKDLTVPFGVVIDNTYKWEKVSEYGEEVEYLTAEIYLWEKRYPELMQAIYDENTWFNESMEISFSNSRPYKEDSNYTEVLDMTFSALCLLQKSDKGDSKENVEPCFISSRVEPIKFSLDKAFNKAFDEMKEKLSACFNDNKIQEGGKNELTQEKINEILAEYEVILEDLDFKIDKNMTEEDFKIKLDEFAKKKKKCSLSKFSAIYEQKRTALQNACDPIIIKDEDDNVISETYFWVSDFNDEYVFVEKNVWSDTDHEHTYGRFTYTFDETNITATLTSEFELMVLTWLTVEENAKLETSRNAFENLQSEFDTYKSDYATPNTEVEELKTFKANTLAEKRIADEAELFAQFDEKLNSDTEYETLKANCKEMSLDEISDKCFSILGKKLANFALNKPKPNPIKLPIAHTDDGDTKPYGDIYEKYLK